MSLIDKAYFTLEEIEERWQLPHRDVVYLAENGLLKLSCGCSTSAWSGASSRISATATGTGS